MRIEGPRVPSDQGGQNTYQVQDGDTFQSIGNQFGINADDLAKANGLASNTKLSAGMELLLPDATQSANQTSGLGGIADRLEPAIKDPSENLGIKFHDQMPEGT